MYVNTCRTGSRVSVVQRAFTIYRLCGAVLHKDTNLPELEKSQLLGWIGPVPSSLTRSPCGGGALTHNALIVEEKRNALFSRHAAKSSTEPGLQTSRGSL